MPEYVKKLAIHHTPVSLPARIVNKLRIPRARAALKGATPAAAVAEGGVTLPTA